MLFNLLIGLHVVVCIVLILVVLLQSSKGGGLAGAFGGGGGQTMFGGQETATFLSRLTTHPPLLFLGLSLLLAFLRARPTRAGPSCPGCGGCWCFRSPRAARVPARAAWSAKRPGSSRARCRAARASM